MKTDPAPQMVDTPPPTLPDAALVDKYIVAAQREAFFANMRMEHRLLFRLTADVSRAIDMRIYQGKRADRDFQRRRPASVDAVSDDIDLGRRSRSE